MSEQAPELEAPDPTLSLDAAHSTYEEQPATKEAVNPPPGPTVIQTLGTPSEATPAKKSASSSSSSS